MILRDYAENVKRMVEMLERIDQPTPMEITSEVIPIKYALASDIQQVLGSLGGGGGAAVGRSTAGGGLGLLGLAQHSGRKRQRHRRRENKPNGPQPPNHRRAAAPGAGFQNNLSRLVKPGCGTRRKPAAGFPASELGPRSSLTSAPTRS